jgi:hypothetical protein
MSLDSVKDVRGRLDVLAFRTTERFIQELESFWGCQGLWDTCKPFVESGINDLRLKKVPLSLMDALGKIIEAKRKVNEV